MPEPTPEAREEASVLLSNDERENFTPRYRVALRLSELYSRIAELELALAKYGTHEPGCLWHEDNDKNACDCGWRAYA